MEIILHDGKQELLLRDGETCFELCEKRQRKGADTWEARSFYHDPGAALSELLRRKVRNSEARTLAELKITIEAARRELMETFSCEVRLCKCG